MTKEEKREKEILDQENGIRYFFNHYYDKQGRPIITSCLMEAKVDDLPSHFPVSSVFYCRGLAICSPLDFGNLSNKRGRVIAKGRAQKASLLGKDCRAIKRPEVFQRITDMDTFVPVIASLWRKCQYEVRPTSEESNQIMERDL